MKEITRWEQVNPVVMDGGESVSLRTIENKYKDMVMVAEALLEYIDAIPQDIDFTMSMPGIDRDWVNSVMDNRA